MEGSRGGVRDPGQDAAGLQRGGVVGGWAGGWGVGACVGGGWRGGLAAFGERWSAQVRTLRVWRGGRGSGGRSSGQEPRRSGVGEVRLLKPPCLLPPPRPLPHPLCDLPHARAWSTTPSGGGSCGEPRLTNWSMPVRSKSSMYSLQQSRVRAHGGSAGWGTAAGWGPAAVGVAQAG